MRARTWIFMPDNTSGLLDSDIDVSIGGRSPGKVCYYRPDTRAAGIVSMSLPELTGPTSTDGNVVDSDGNTTVMVVSRGIHYPAFSGILERLENLSVLTAREDDVVISACAKAGTHWLWEMTTMLVNGKAETVHADKLKQFIEFVDDAELLTHPSPRVLNTHVFPQIYPPDLLRKKCKMIRIHRNPKDVFVSHYHHTKNILLYGYEHGNWPAYYELCMAGKVEFGGWFDHTLAWETFQKFNLDMPVLTLFYEDLKRNLPLELRRISDYLGLSVSKALIEDIAHLCSFDHMKKEKPKHYPAERIEFWKNGEYKMFRKGVCGDWKNLFTVAQSEHFDAEFERRMKDSTVHIKWE